MQWDTRNKGTPTQAGRLVVEHRWYNAARSKGGMAKKPTMHPMTWMTCAQFRRNIGRSAMTGACLTRPLCEEAPV